MEYMIIDFQKQDIKPCTNTNYVLASLHMQCLGTSTNRQTDRRTDRLKRKYSDHVYRYPLSFDCNLWLKFKFKFFIQLKQIFTLEQIT